DDLAVALEDLGLDLADVFVREDRQTDVAGQDLRARFTHARRTQRIRGARPPELGRRAFPTLEERPWRPRRLEGTAGEPPIHCLKSGPSQVRETRGRGLDHK